MAQNLLCKEESAAGVGFDIKSRTWSSITSTSDRTFVVRKSSNTLARLEVGEVGSKAPVAFCENDFDRDHLRCRGFFQEFFFNRAEMRFLRIYYAGYWNERSLTEISPEHKEGSDTPSVAIGKCTNL